MAVNMADVCAANGGIVHMNFQPDRSEHPGKEILHPDRYAGLSILPVMVIGVVASNADMFSTFILPVIISHPVDVV